MKNTSRRRRLIIEPLESRQLLAVVNWVPGGGGYFNSPGNWDTQQPLAANDTAKIGTTASSTLKNIPPGADGVTIGTLEVDAGTTSLDLAGSAMNVDHVNVNGPDGTLDLQDTEAGGTIVGNSVPTTTIDLETGGALQASDDSAIASDYVFDNGTVSVGGSANLDTEDM